MPVWRERAILGTFELDDRSKASAGVGTGLEFGDGATNVKPIDRPADPSPTLRNEAPVAIGGPPAAVPPSETSRQARP